MSQGCCFCLLLVAVGDNYNGSVEINITVQQSDARMLPWRA